MSMTGITFQLYVDALTEIAHIHSYESKRELLRRLSR